MALPKLSFSLFMIQTTFKISNVTHESLDIEAEETDINECVRKLVAGGSDIYGVQKLQTSLEDAFLEITGGGIKVE